MELALFLPASVIAGCLLVVLRPTESKPTRYVAIGQIVAAALLGLVTTGNLDSLAFDGGNVLLAGVGVLLSLVLYVKVDLHGIGAVILYASSLQLLLMLEILRT
jgi:hypothetical protein